MSVYPPKQNKNDSGVFSINSMYSGMDNYTVLIYNIVITHMR